MPRCVNSKPEHAAELSHIIPDALTPTPGNEPQSVCALVTEFLNETAEA